MDGRTRHTRSRKGGRPSKGDRHLFQSRVPKELAETVMVEAERSGLTYSDYIALLIAEKHDYRLPDHYYRRPDTNSVQEEFPMKTAS